MKKKGLVIATILFFLLVNTTYYWESNLGIFSIFSMLLLLLYFIVLVILLLRQTFSAYKDKFADKQRNYLISLMTLFLALTFFFPGGLINFDKFAGDNILVAQREGAANCTTTLKLKNNNNFIQKSVCFGSTEIKGIYKIKGDTIFFDKISQGRDSHEFYEYGVIKSNKDNAFNSQSSLDLFKNSADTIGTTLPIIKNNLTNTKNAL
jgi:Ca2+/Na+ antiporter